jgi:hypothetical protein
MTETTDQTKTLPQDIGGVLAEIQRRIAFIGKDDWASTSYTDKTKGFNFRGIDAVLNTVGPLVRELNLLVVPRTVDRVVEMHDTGKDRKPTRFVGVSMEWRLIAPDGSEMTVGPVYGEAADSGDRAGAKAASVAFRTMWLQLLVVPTGDPEPEHSTYEVAKPEAEISDPKIIAALEKKITDAASRAALEKIFKTDIVKAYETDATITKADADRLSRMIGGRLPEFDQAAKA